MKLKIEPEINTGNIIIKILLTENDLVNVKLDEFDKRLVDECEKSNSIADKLLGLETIARRLEQAKSLYQKNHFPTIINQP